MIVNQIIRSTQKSKSKDRKSTLKKEGKYRAKSALAIAYIFATITLATTLWPHQQANGPTTKHSDWSYRQVNQQTFFLQNTAAIPGAWHGIRRVPLDDLHTVAINLDGQVIEFAVRTETASQITIMLDQAEAVGYQVILNMYTSTTHTNRPWYWNGNEWIFPQSTIDILKEIAHHPALFAIYSLHEPLDEGEGHVSVEQQRQLYQQLKDFTDGLPVFTDIGGLSVWEDRGVELTDGICDYCCTFPSHFRSDWTSEACVAETLRRIDTDLDTQQRLMPNSQIVFLINTYTCANCTHPFRLPTRDELSIVRDYICSIEQQMMYYPWTHSLYDETLKDAPHLWPSVAQGCTCTLYLPSILANAGSR